MRTNRYPILLSILTVAFILLALAAESVYFSDFEYRFRTKMFNKTLIAKETVMEDCLNAMKPILANVNHHGSISENNLFSIADQNKISILEYLDNKLIYWSDNEFDVPAVFVDSLFDKPLVFLQNGWFLTKTIQAGNEKVIGLLRLHTDYSFDKEGDFLFSLSFPEVKGNTCFIFIPLCLWAGAFILIILLSFELVKLLVSKGNMLIGICIPLLVFTSIYIIILFNGRPHAIFQTELFSPYRFSMNKVIPSLGHLVVLGILAAAFTTVLYRHLPIRERKGSKRIESYLFLLVLLMGGAFILSLYQWVFGCLLYTSPS